MFNSINCDRARTDAISLVDQHGRLPVSYPALYLNKASVSECDDRHTEVYAFWFNLRRRSNELGSLTSGGSVRHGTNRFKSAMTIGPRPRRHRARRVVNWVDANS